MTNKANCYFAEQEYERAKHYYEDALKIDASCVEALYNLGLTYSKIGMYEQALDQFFKLHAMQRSNTQIYAKMAEINAKKSDRMYILVPASEAYGSAGSEGFVKPNESLFYNLLVMDVVN